MDVVFFVEQSQELPKLAFANDFSFAGFDGGLCGLVKERRRARFGGQRQFFADHDELRQRWKLSIRCRDFYGAGVRGG